MPSSAGFLKGSRRVSLPALQLSPQDLPFDPRNEAGVAVLFGQLADRLDFKIVDAQANVPDLTVVRRGERIRVELEYSSKGLAREVKDGNWEKCDLVLVVCWRHDWGSFPEG